MYLRAGSRDVRFDLGYQASRRGTTEEAAHVESHRKRCPILAVSILLEEKRDFRDSFLAIYLLFCMLVETTMTLPY